jgi:hypothetical protein
MNIRESPNLPRDPSSPLSSTFNSLFPLNEVLSIIMPGTPKDDGDKDRHIKVGGNRDVRRVNGGWSVCDRLVVLLDSLVEA